MVRFLSLCIAALIASGPVHAESPPPPPSENTYHNTLSGDYLAGQAARRRQDWKAANDFVSRALARDPANTDLGNSAMVLAMGAGETGRAVALARKTLEREKGNVLALLFLSLDSFARQDYAGAAKTLSSMPRGSVADFIKPILLAWAQSGRGAITLESLPAVANPLYAYHGILIADSGNKFGLARDHLQAFLQSPTLDGQEAERVADILARRGKRGEAEKLYRMLLSEYPNRPDIIVKLADSSKKGVMASAPVATPEQGAAEAFYDTARILFREGSEDSAIVFSRMALHLNPRLSGARVMLAHIAARNGRTDEALAHYAAIEKDDAFGRAARLEAAEVMERAGRVEDAVALLTSINASGKDIDSLIQIGEVYRRAERYEDALAAYDRAAAAIGKDIPPQYWHLLYARGMVQERLKNMDAAEKDLSTAIKLQPEHPYLLNYLGYSWAEQGKNLDQALELIERAVTIKPDDGSIVDSFGWILFQRGRYEEAVVQLEIAAALLPYDPVINDHLGDAYWRTGRTAEARFQWRRALGHTDDMELTETITKKLDNGLAALPTPSGVKEAMTGAGR